MKLSRKACAKINLGLRILDRMPDGYHAIETVYVELDWGDMLFVEPAAELSLHCRGIPLPLVEDNLVFRAARALQRDIRIERGAKITLDKVIPVGSGLGGGSSDAAAALLLLCELWEAELGMDLLVRIARSLGADVPFFLKGGTAYATGIGDVLVPVEWGFDGWIVLFHPEWEVSTPWAYERWDQLGRAPSSPLPLSDYLDRLPGDPGFRDLFTNNFESIVLDEFPALRNSYNQFWETGADHVGLSGSGSSLFGLFSDRDQAALGLQWAQSHGWGCLTRRSTGEFRERGEAG